MKVAVTVVSAESVSLHVPVPLHPPPDQPAKPDPATADAVSVTAVPPLKLAEHWLLVALQSMPEGRLVTWPVRVPPSETVSPYVCVKVAVTLTAEFKVRTQDPVPLHSPPLQPSNTDPAAGVAVRVTVVPPANDAAHSLLLALQLMPAGLLVTWPPPLPFSITVRVSVVKVAVMLVSAVKTTTQVPVPVHSPPLHPAKLDLAAGKAARVTGVAAANIAAHSLLLALQLMPVGLLVTWPLPVPASATLKVVAGTVILNVMGPDIVAPYASRMKSP